MPMLQRLGRYIASRAREPSSWAGVSLALLPFSRYVPPDVVQLLEWWGPAIAGALVAADEGRDRA